MRIVVALGGNALQQRGEQPSALALSARIAEAARAIAEIDRDGHNQLVITHGNGPQIGLLALQADAYDEVPAFPMDMLGAQSVGLIGYLIERELTNALPRRSFATLLTQVRVDPADPAFATPTKPIGPGYDLETATMIAADRGWTLAPDGDQFRRVVPSPTPREVMGLVAIRALIDAGVTVIAGGGGGIPVAQNDSGRFSGVEAVVDKDLTAALLARDLKADHLLLLTDVESVVANWGQNDARSIRRATPSQLDGYVFDPGSMGPKIRAACNFVRENDGAASIGAISDAAAVLDGRAGTTIRSLGEHIEFVT